MKTSHDLQWIESRWRRLNRGEQVEGQLLLGFSSKSGTSQSGVEKPRSRASTVIRREPTPNSRHIQRIIAQVAKVDGEKAMATTAGQTQVLKAPANFGKPWSAPPREFDKLTVGAPTSSKKRQL
jgi:hypothetical protein